jgi:uncharacterized protein YbcI
VTGELARAPRLESAISGAMVRIMREFYGKGAVRARTYVLDDYVFAVLEDVLTRLEQTLVAGGDQALVREVRLTFQDIMTDTLTGEVERLTGRRVVGYHSQVVFDPDLAIEFFVLDPERRPAGAPDEQAGQATAPSLAPPGRPGDADALPAMDRPATRGADVVGGQARAATGDGRLRTAISNAMVRLVRERYGRGPTRAKTFCADEFVFCVLEDLLTTVERTLVGGGRADLVRRLRLRFHEQEAGTFAREVQALTGRQVVAGHTQIVFRPDVLLLVFVLGS